MNTATAERVHLARRILAGVERLEDLDRWTTAHLDELAELERTTLADAVLDDLAALARRVAR